MKTWQNLQANPHLFQRYFVKEYLIQSVREFFLQKSYHELESPILAEALPQERYLNVFNVKLKEKAAYIIPTTETYNKKILAAGLGEHFVITKVARNMEETGPNHLPEFTMLEWYHLNANYKDLMTDTEDLFNFLLPQIADKLLSERELRRFPIDLSLIEALGAKKIVYKENIIDFSKGFLRFSIPELLTDHLKISLEEIQDTRQFIKKAQSLGVNVKQDESWQICYEMLFAQLIEPKLPQNTPFFIYDFPKQICVLTAPKKENPNVCERVEFFIAGQEIGNGYTELLDPMLQKKNFDLEQKARKNLGLEPINYDYDLVEALKSGLPPVAGIGMGLDRIAAILSNTKSIADVNYFPASEWK